MLCVFVLGLVVLYKVRFFRIENMGIQRKIFLGFITIGFILFLSGLISIIQLTRIGNTVTSYLSDNILSMEVSRKLSDEIDEQVWGVFQQSVSNVKKHSFNEEVYDELISRAEANITVKGEDNIIDSLKYSYQLFKKSNLEVDSIFSLPYLDRSDWVECSYMPAVRDFVFYVKQLQDVNQSAITQKSLMLKSNYHRTILPPIIAIVIGFILVFLFNYFLNIYFIRPLTDINKGIQSYIDHRLPYNVKVESKDEIQNLNEGVKDLISSLKKFDVRKVNR